MAILPSFYNQVDQDIYTGGEHYIPQENYRLGYTAPPSIANASTGITNTNVAKPYIWPPQGGGGGGDGGGGQFHNVYGYDPNVSKQFDIQTWDRISNPVHDFDTGKYGWVNKTVTGYKSPSGWKTEKGKNIHNFGIDYTPSWAKAIGLAKEKIQGNRPGEIKGTFSDAEDAEDVWDIIKQKVRNVPIIKRWRENKEIKKQEKAAIEQAGGTDGGSFKTGDKNYGFDDVSGDFTGEGLGGSSGPSENYGFDDSGNFTGEGLSDSSGPSEDYGFDDSGNFTGEGLAQGGRIGYNRGRVVNPGGYSGNTYSDFLADKTVIPHPDDKSWRDVFYRWLDSRKAQGGLIGYFDGGIAGLL